jgi:hypothetical protein
MRQRPAGVYTNRRLTRGSIGISRRPPGVQSQQYTTTTTPALGRRHIQQGAPPATTTSRQPMPNARQMPHPAGGVTSDNSQPNHTSAAINSYHYILLQSKGTLLSIISLCHSPHLLPVQTTKPNLIINSSTISHHSSYPEKLLPVLRPHYLPKHRSIDQRRRPSTPRPHHHQTHPSTDQDAAHPSHGFISIQDAALQTRGVTHPTQSPRTPQHDIHPE